MTVASDAAAPSDSGPDAAVEKRGRRRKRRRPNSGEAEVEAEAAPGAEDEQPTAASDESQSAGRRRYIVFVGNLPYRVSVADVQRLFSAMRPVGCRLPTDKANRKPKGYAFVEFDDAACMRRALQLHHSVLGGRAINVELTAGGGGGRSAVRRERIQLKNAALTKERRAAMDRQSAHSRRDGAQQAAGEQAVADGSGREENQPSATDARAAGEDAADDEHNDSDRRKSKRRKRKDRSSSAAQGLVDANSDTQT